MAFQQPQQVRPQAARTTSNSNHAALQTQQIPQHDDLCPQQSREWIIFSPDSPSVTGTHTVSTAKTPQTAGRSRLSELGSSNSRIVFDHGQEGPETELEEHDTEDLDSLDDGLHAFQDHSFDRKANEHSSDALLPAHDGLGMFTAGSVDVQAQLWEHERYNPRRRHLSLRESSLQQNVAALEEEHDQNHEEQRFFRIEQWRAEQSRAILEEIERESRRRRKREDVIGSPTTSQTVPLSTQSHKPPGSSHITERQSTCTDTESFWTRFTKRVICDIIGLDDATLFLIFGESVEASNDPIPSAEDMLKEAERIIPNEDHLVEVGQTWQERLVARVAKELGVLVFTLTEPPSRFSMDTVQQDVPLYPGLLEPTSKASPASRHRSEPAPIPHNSMSTSALQFKPSLTHPKQSASRHSLRTDPSLWGIEEEDEHIDTSVEEAQHVRKECDYWEQDLDVKSVFKYIRQWLLSTRAPQDQHSPSESAARIITSSTVSRRESDSLRRAALIRRHHPLVCRNVAVSVSGVRGEHLRRMSRGTAVTQVPPVLGRRQSDRGDDRASCASQSTKRSKTARSASSRNYWDVGTGSLGSGGWNASWGEV